MRFVLLVALVILAGCATTTTIETTEDTYTVESSADSLVSLKKGDVEIVVDNRGRPSFLETFFSTLIMKAPDIQVDGDG